MLILLFYFQIFLIQAWLNLEMWNPWIQRAGCIYKYILQTANAMWHPGCKSLLHEPGVVAHTYDPNTLGDQGGWIS